MAHIKGKPSHNIVERGLEVLANMDHRGATSADNATGDGAGILMQIPHEFITKTLNVNVGVKGQYGTGWYSCQKMKMKLVNALISSIKILKLKALLWLGTVMFLWIVLHLGRLLKLLNPVLSKFLLKETLSRMH